MLVSPRFLTAGLADNAACLNWPCNTVVPSASQIVVAVCGAFSRVFQATAVIMDIFRHDPTAGPLEGDELGRMALNDFSTLHAGRWVSCELRTIVHHAHGADASFHTHILIPTRVPEDLRRLAPHWLPAVWHQISTTATPPLIPRPFTLTVFKNRSGITSIDVVFECNSSTESPPTSPSASLPTDLILDSATASGIEAVRPSAALPAPLSDTMSAVATGSVKPDDSVTVLAVTGSSRGLASSDKRSSEGHVLPRIPGVLQVITKDVIGTTARMLARFSPRVVHISLESFSGMLKFASHPRLWDASGFSPSHYV